MSKSWEQRRRLRVGEFEYLLDDDDLTAWITEARSKGARVYTLPDRVDINSVMCRITSIEIGAYNSEEDANVEELYFPDSYEFFDEFNFSQAPLKIIHIGKGMSWYHYWTFSSAANDVTIIIDPDNPFIKMSEDGHFVLSKDGKELIYMVHDIEEASVPEGVESIVGCAISCKNNLRHVHLPSSLKSIAIDGMIQNRALESIVVPEGVSMIGHQAFCGDTALEIADLPSTITVIDSDTFMDAGNLSTIVLRAPIVVNVCQMGHDWFDDFPLNSCRLVVPRNLIPEYRKHPVWGWFKHIDSIEGTEHV